MEFDIGINTSVTNLPRILDLTGYEVSVQDIYVPAAVLHSGTDFKIRVSTDSGLSYPHTLNVKLPEGVNWPAKAIDSLSQAIAEYALVSIDKNGYVAISTNSDSIQLQLPNSLVRTLGLSSNTVNSKPTSGSHLVCYNMLYERIFVFCNFIHPYLVNGRYMPCVYMGPPSQFIQYGSYKRTINGQFYSLHVSFYNAFWEQISIPDKTFSLRLNFKKP